MGTTFVRRPGNNTGWGEGGGEGGAISKHPKKSISYFSFIAHLILEKVSVLQQVFEAQNTNTILCLPKHFWVLPIPLHFCVCQYTFGVLPRHLCSVLPIHFVVYS